MCRTTVWVFSCAGVVVVVGALRFCGDLGIFEGGGEEGVRVYSSVGGKERGGLEDC